MVDDSLRWIGLRPADRDLQCLLSSPINEIQVVALAARNALPQATPLVSFAAAGGQMTYGSRLADSYRQAGTYTRKILKGTKPADPRKAFVSQALTDRGYQVWGGAGAIGLPSLSDIDSAFTTLVKNGAGALIVDGGRTSSHAAQQIRAGDQPQQDARPRCAADAVRPRRNAVLRELSQLQQQPRGAGAMLYRRERLHPTGCVGGDGAQ